MNRTAFTVFTLLLLVAVSGLAVIQTNANPIVTPIIHLMSPRECVYDTDKIDLIFEANPPDELNITLTSFSYSLDGKPKIPLSGNITLDGLSMGTHSVIIYGVDTDGWTQTSQLVHFDIYIPSTWIIAIPVLLTIAIIAVLSIVYIKKRRNKQAK